MHVGLDDPGVDLRRRSKQFDRRALVYVHRPDPTDSYVPVPYGRFVEEVELHVPRVGLRVVRAEFALAREGLQMFGVLTCTNGRTATRTRTTRLP